MIMFTTRMHGAILNSHVNSSAMFPDRAIVNISVIHSQKGPYRSGDWDKDDDSLQGYGTIPATTRRNT